ncbi:hypothetical protein SBDP1_100007 [Syntrophobacter sp. SbD1]|nr:hypothetical protein SBDP1_100007 [Syntrophobacter sp. SbD1]
MNIHQQQNAVPAIQEFQIAIHCFASDFVSFSLT